MGESLGTRSGGCLCGAVRFVVTAKPEMGVCHCDKCRRWSGGAFTAVQVDDLAIENADALAYYRSSSHAERGFCKVCGSSLVWRFQDGSLDFVSLQAFDDQTGFVFHEQIYVDEKPAIYDFANKTKMMSGADVIAAFEGGESSGG